MKVGTVLKMLPVACGLAAFGLAPATAIGAVVSITPISMGDWAFDNRDATGTVIGGNPTGSGAIVSGPASPPYGTGSANLQTGNGTTGGDATWELRNTGYAGTRLDAITSLSYYAFMANNSPNNQQFPYLGLTLSMSGGSVADDVLFFEPPYQQPSTGKPGTPDQGATALNTWQVWNALIGSWWANSSPFVGGSGTTGCGPGTDACTLTDYLAQHPDATIVNASSGLGGIRFNVGFGNPEDIFDGNIDGFTIGFNNGEPTTFDFDPAGEVPLPAALPLFGSGLGVLGFFGWRRKRKQTKAAV